MRISLGPTSKKAARLCCSNWRAASALEAWRGVRAIGGGALAARAFYALGAGLQADGKRAEAIDAFGQARTEASLNGDAALAAAASDRLADLGVAPR